MIEDAFTVPVRVAIRRCRQEDLPALEWWGLFAAHRDLIRDVFDRQQCDAGAEMLVAEANGMAAGQAWIDLSRRERDSTGVIWAVRVFPCLQGCGIGTRLMRAAEGVLRAQGLDLAEVMVERDAEGPRRWYEWLGYAETALPPGTLATLAPPGSPPPPEGSQRVLRKRLHPAREGEEP